MAYVPLVNANDDDYEDGLELSDIDLEKTLGSPSTPEWFRLGGWRTSSNKWELPTDWKTRAKEGMLYARTAASVTFGYFLAALPRFLQPGGLKVKKELQPTAYLDALRGWSALLVFRFHAYGENKTWLFDQYIISGFLNGRAMVEVFFIISGYVLSYRLLKMIRNQEPGLLRALASSTFRRWFRLFIPTGIGSLIVAVLSHFGLCQGDFRLESFPAQIWDWFGDFLWASNPFAEIKGWWYIGVFRTKFLDPMWTIPVEFRGSMVLFSFCTVAAYLSTKGRRICCAILILLCYYWWTIYAAVFLVGMLIADVQFDRHPERLHSKKHFPLQPRLEISNDAASPSPTNRSRMPSIFRTLGCILLVITALILFGQPKDGQSYQGPFPYDYLSLAIPTSYPVDLGEYFWLSIGAALLVFGLDNCRMLQIPFEWSLSQYLGDISFGIYVMHDIVIWVFYVPVVEPFRQEHFGESFWSVVPGMLVTTVVVLWCADWFGRIDDRIVWLGRWMETKSFITWDETP